MSRQQLSLKELTLLLLAIILIAVPATGETGTSQIYAVADAFIDDHDPNGNHGYETYAIVGEWDGSSPYRRSRYYLRFDLDGIPDFMTVTYATLNLSCDATYSPPVQVGAHYVADDSWNEMSITWASPPGDPSATATDTDIILLGYNSWDITTDIQLAYTGDGVISLAMLVPNEGGTAKGARFRTREDSAPVRPYLEVAYTNDPPNPFVEMQELPGTMLGGAAWGDFVGDNGLDLVYCGITDTDTVTYTYENQAGMLVPRPQTGLIGVFSPCGKNLAWGDYDNDGDLDLAMCGMATSGEITRIYNNDGGNLTWDSAQNLQPVKGAVAWGDVDNDGDLDLFVQGIDGSSRKARLYINHPVGTLNESTGVSFTGLSAGVAEWCDLNNDGDQDLVCSGHDGSTARIIFYENDPVGVLTSTGDRGVPAAGLSDLAWGDYDDDGDLDLAKSGNEGAGDARTRILENDGNGNFSAVTDLAPYFKSCCSWGDYDNDGDLDLLANGIDHFGAVSTQLYANDTGVFDLVASWYGQVYSGATRWADVDQDGDLDFFICGRTDDDTGIARLYDNQCALYNHAPSPPLNLYFEMHRGLRLGWDGAWDIETDDDALYYEVRIGTTSAGHEILSGSCGSPLFGNVRQATELVLDVPYGTYYWSVRSIDAGLVASPWSDEVTVTRNQPTVWYLDDEFPTDQWESTLPGWERMDSGPLWREVKQLLLPGNTYLADTGPLSADYSGYHFLAELWCLNSGPGRADRITAELCLGGWGYVDSVLATGPDHAIVGLGLHRYTFDFGDLDSLELDNQSLVLRIHADAANLGTTTLYWDGSTRPGGLRCVGPDDLDSVACEPQGGGNPTHPGIYWYDVAPAMGICDFHVQLSDSNPASYTSPSLPAASWQFAVHQVGTEWWASWWDAERLNPVWGSYRFQYEHDNPPVWSFWRTTTSGTSDPYREVNDFCEIHRDEVSGQGYLVHVPGPVITDAGEPMPDFRRQLELGPNTPNPFNPQTRIDYVIPDGAVTDRVTLRVYDLAGRLIRTLVDSPQSAGRYEVVWDGNDRVSRAASSGVYFYRLSWRGVEQTRRMLLVR